MNNETIEPEHKSENVTEASSNLTTLASVNFAALALELTRDYQAEKENIDELRVDLGETPLAASNSSPSKTKAAKSRRKVHACSLCAYKTTKKMLLQRHLSVHDTDKPFKCEHCERSFRDPHQLANHANIHMGTKPFKCTECELGFTTRGEMIRHTKYK